MKHLVALLFLVGSYQSLKAQHWTVGAQWIYWQEDFFPDDEDEYRRFIKEKDTLIQNQIWSQILEKYVVKNGNTLQEYAQKRYFLRQDSQQVLVLEPDSMQVFPLYDFSKTTGDFFFSYCPDAGQMIQLQIDSVTTSNFGSQILKVQWVHTAQGGSCYMSGPIYERIGSSAYLFPRPAFADPAPGGGLICFSDSLLSFPGSGNCTLSVNSTEPSLAESFKIYPNPTTENLFFEPENVKEIRVFNTFGQLLKTQTAELSVSLKGFPDGVYFLEFQTPEGNFLKRAVKKS